jgi:aldose 1-epimerase
MGVVELRCERATVTLAPELGGRIASIVVDGRELLVAGDASSHPMMWGCFPMVPFAGRIRRGRFRYEARSIHLPVNFDPHAIHGTGYDAAWSVQGDGTLVHQFPDTWPFGGHAVQRFELDEDGLTCTIEVHADRQPMPAMAGWHPWYRRPVELTFAAGQMYERDADHMPSGALVTPTPRPWDDCFTDVDQPVVLAFEDGPTVAITSSCDHWVVYDMPDNAICVEPQTGPPDQFNLAKPVAEPGESLTAWMRLAWE